MRKLLLRIHDWVVGIPPIEREVAQLLQGRESMTPSEWLDLACPYYDSLNDRLPSRARTRI